MGVGAKQRICLDTCEQWYEDCRDDYFAFKELRGSLAPCSHGSLICTELKVGASLVSQLSCCVLSEQELLRQENEEHTLFKLSYL